MSRASRRRAFCEARRLAGMVPASVAAPRRVHGALKRETRSASVSWTRDGLSLRNGEVKEEGRKSAGEARQRARDLERF